jgi:hypothetical protein
LILATAAADQNETSALEHAWKAALDPATTISGRARVAEILIHERSWDDVIAALTASGPWQTDPVCRNLQAFAHLMRGEPRVTTPAREGNSERRPAGYFALALLWLAETGKDSERLSGSGRGSAAHPELAAQFLALKQYDIAAKVLDQFYLNRIHRNGSTPLAQHWEDSLPGSGGSKTCGELGSIKALAADDIHPTGLQDEEVLRAAA